MRNKLADSIRDKAKKIAADDGQLSNLIHNVRKKVDEISKSEQLKQLFSTVELLIKMVKRYLSGEYRNYPKRTLLLILFGLIYFLTPIDAIPDFIPVSGFLDDLTVLLWVYKSIQKDIVAYPGMGKAKNNFSKLSQD